MSRWATAQVAANRAVAAPTTAMTVRAPEATSSRGFMRAMRYTPEVTMVAAWMRAETGVGPSMASGSHTYSGSCADFPAAPTNSSRAMARAVVSERLPTLSKMPDSPT